MMLLSCLALFLMRYHKKTFPEINMEEIQQEIQQKKEDTIQLSKSTLWQIVSGVLGILLIISIFTSGFGFGNDSSPTGGAVVNPTNPGNNIPTGPVEVSA